MIPHPGDASFRFSVIPGCHGNEYRDRANGINDRKKCNKGCEKVYHAGQKKKVDGNTRGKNCLSFRCGQFAEFQG